MIIYWFFLLAVNAWIALYDGANIFTLMSFSIAAFFIGVRSVEEEG